MAALPFTLRQLEIFELLCDLQSFRHTSERLGITQASVSNQLKVLEEQMGVRLLTRDAGRRPQLTTEGAAFLADLTPFWNAAGKLARHRRRGGIRRVEAPRVKAMVGMQLLHDYVRPKLGQFLNDNPGIHLMFDSAAAFFGPRDAITKEHFDIGLFSENTVNPLNETLHEVTKVRCGIFGHRKFAAKHPHPMTPAELSELPFVLPPSGSFHEGETLDMLTRHDIRPTKIVSRTQYFDVMSTMFEAGTCVGVTLEPLLTPGQRREAVMLHRLDDWRLTLYRSPEARQPQSAVTEEFLTSCILDDPTFPKFSEDD